MRSPTLIAIAALSLAAACSKEAPSSSSPSAPSAPTTRLQTANAPQNDVVWSPAPPVLPPGAEIAVLQGDPSKAEPFTIRLRLPSGYRLPPHTHPTMENVTVLTGNFLTGMGGQFDESNMQAYGRDDFVSIPADHAHYVLTRGLTVVQVHAIGPFALTYVNAADGQKFR